MKKLLKHYFLKVENLNSDDYQTNIRATSVLLGILIAPLITFAYIVYVCFNAVKVVIRHIMYPFSLIANWLNK